MKIKFVYGILPAFVFVSGRLVKDRSSAQARGPLIFMKPKFDIMYTNGRAVLAHELVHVKQWYRTFFTHPFLYKFSQVYRANAEIEAYRAQSKVYPLDMTAVAAIIERDYDIKDISLAEILRRLTA